LGGRDGCQEVIVMMASSSWHSEWLRTIVRINEGLSLVFQVVSSIEKHLESKTAHSRVLEFSLRSCGATSGHRASPRVLRRALWS
ncbi:hypothetical protein PanWU01x14_095720, partial [Parasponia andersonii]